MGEHRQIEGEVVVKTRLSDSKLRPTSATHLLPLGFQTLNLPGAHYTLVILLGK